MNAILIILGFILLIVGHQLPWVFVATAGFISGLFLAEHPVLALSGMSLITFSTGLALVSGLLVIYLKRFMVVLAGFLAGVYVCNYLPEALHWDIGGISWPVLILVGAIFAILILVWYGLPLIVVSSIAGATLVVQYIQFHTISEVPLFIILLIFGIIAQYVLMQYNRSEG